MASVDLRPGDTLNIVWTGKQDTPFGSKDIETSFSFKYEELLSKLRAKGIQGKSRRSGTEGARFSRMVALACNAMKKGKWSTGADIDRDKVFERLMRKFKTISDVEYQFITSHAREALNEIYNNPKLLKTQQKKDLKVLLDAAQIPV